jgi:hypothetical protein
MIPKCFIQTWKTRTIPRRYKAFQRRLRKLHPDYEFRFFTDDEVESFVRREYPEFSEAYDALPDVISRIDLFRLLAVHKHGGFYLDIDVLPHKPFDELLNHHAVFPFERYADPFFAARYGTLEMIGQYAFGAEPGHPFLMACAENIRKVALEPDSLRLPSSSDLASLPEIMGNAHSFRVLYTAGPGMVTRTFIESPESRGGLKLIAALDERNPELVRKVTLSFGNFASHQVTGSWLTGMPVREIILTRLVARLIHRRNAGLLKSASLSTSSELVMVDCLCRDPGTAGVSPSDQSAGAGR